MARSTPAVPAVMAPSSKRSASPPSNSSTRAPAFAASARREPSRICACRLKGAANSSANDRTCGSSMSPRIWGRFTRWSDPVCRSMPTEQRATTSVIMRCAMRPAREPRGEPGKDRLRSRRSGRNRSPVLKPNTLTTGTASTVPDRVLASSAPMTRRMISTPHSSSPCTAALSQMVGPSSRPCRTITGSDTVVPVTNLEIGNSNWRERPACTECSAMAKGARLCALTESVRRAPKALPPDPVA